MTTPIPAGCQRAAESLQKYGIGITQDTQLLAQLIAQETGVAELAAALRLFMACPEKMEACPEIAAAQNKARSLLARHDQPASRTV